MKALHLTLASAVLGAALLAGSDAKAAGHASGFGDKGQLILSADRLVPLFGYAHESVNATNNNNVSTSTSSSEISLLFAHPGAANSLLLDVHSIPRVAVDFTVINNLTLGLGLGFLFGLGGTVKTTAQNGATTVTTNTDAPTGTMIGIAPRVGYIFALGEHLAFWPRAGFGFYSVNAKAKDTNNNNGNQTTTEITDTSFSLDLDPQLTIIPVENFFFTVGPTLNIPVTGTRSESVTTGATTTSASQDTSLLHFGINASIGGWIDLF